MKSSTQPDFDALFKLRSGLSEWYEIASWGQALRELESQYLSRALNASYNQVIIQMGALGWEDRFIDREFHRKFFVIDQRADCNEANVRSALRNLPIRTDSVDTVIMAHSLEFEPDQHQVLREVERILKPEGRLFYLGFSPWTPFGLMHYLPRKKQRPPWCGHFVSRRKMLDWLSLLNFEAKVKMNFRVRPGKPGSGIAYAMKAIKRRYTIIPLGPVGVRARLLSTQALNNKACQDCHE